MAFLIIAVVLIAAFMLIKWLSAVWWIILLVICGLALFFHFLPVLMDFLENILFDLSISISEHRDRKDTIRLIKKIEDSKTISCPNCAAAIEPGVKYCKYCGSKVR